MQRSDVELSVARDRGKNLTGDSFFLDYMALGPTNTLIFFFFKVFVACITEQYSTRPRSTTLWATTTAAKEFEFVLDRGCAFIEPVVTEAAMCDQSLWGNGKLNLLKPAFIDDSKAQGELWRRC